MKVVSDKSTKLKLVFMLSSNLLVKVTAKFVRLYQRLAGTNRQNIAGQCVRMSYVFMFKKKTVGKY